MTSPQMFSQHPPFLQLLFLRWTSYGMGYPFGYLGQLAQLFPFSISCPSPAYRPSKLLVGCWRESPDTAQQYPNPCATSAILTTDEKHRPYRLLWRKLSPSQPNPVWSQFECCLTNHWISETLLIQVSLKSDTLLWTLWLKLQITSTWSLK